MVRNQRGSWQQVAAERKANPGTRKLVARNVGPHVVLTLRNHGLTIETTISTPRAVSGKSYDLYNVTAWYDVPATERAQLEELLRGWGYAMVPIERDVHNAQREVDDLTKLRNRALHRLRESTTSQRQLQDQIDTTQLKLNQLSE